MAIVRPLVVLSSGLKSVLPAADSLPGVIKPVVTITAAETLAATRSGTFMVVNSATALNLTVATTTDLADAEICGVQQGAGQITFVAGAGVTINVDARFGRKTYGQYSPWFLKRTAANVWVLGGALGAP